MQRQSAKRRINLIDGKAGTVIQPPCQHSHVRSNYVLDSEIARHIEEIGSAVLINTDCRELVPKQIGNDLLLPPLWLAGVPHQGVADMLVSCRQPLEVEARLSRRGKADQNDALRHARFVR